MLLLPVMENKVMIVPISWAPVRQYRELRTWPSIR